MLWFSGRYVKVWKVEVKEKFVKVKLSSSDKQQDGTYKNSNWNAIFIGSCLDKAKKLQEKDVINIEKGKIENIWSKEKETNYLNLVVFAFDVEGESSTPAPKKKEVKNVVTSSVEEDFDEDEFPF